MTKLKLFRIEGSGTYSGAMCVVAAPDAAHAALDAKLSDEYFFTTPFSIVELPGEYIGAPGILAAFSYSE